MSVSLPVTFPYNIFCFFMFTTTFPHLHFSPFTISGLSHSLSLLLSFNSFYLGSQTLFHVIVFSSLFFNHCLSQSLSLLLFFNTFYIGSQALFHAIIYSSLFFNHCLNELPSMLFSLSWSFPFYFLH